MLRLLVDENFKEQIVTGLRRRLSGLDVTVMEPEEIRDRVLRLPL